MRQDNEPIFFLTSILNKDNIVRILPDRLYLYIGFLKVFVLILTSGGLVSWSLISKKSVARV